ncbi:phage portal protein [Planomicrobium chinense]|uniref:phage portal protein n=1 Tax=Planococcus chinensis TaxID=272917 RepID=UPI001CC6C8CB|nr:phage portal protein [Planococcus chinensis]MBZ5203205.1 phage portal protein [Planococcus chinensis]
MGIFIKGETRALHTDEEMQLLVSTLPGFVGVDSAEYTGVEAIKNSDVFTAVMMIASDLAKMRIQVTNSGIHDPTDKLETLFNVRPNKAYNGYIFKLTVFANALLTKNGYIEIVRSPQGEPLELYHLKTSRMALKQKAGSTELYYEYTTIDANNKEKKRNIPFDNVVDVKPYSLNGTDGISILASLTEDLDTQKYSKKFFANFFKNGTQAGGLLTMKGSKLSKDAREKLRDEWQKSNSGQAQAGKVLILDETMDYKQLEVDTEILKLINTSQHSTAQVAKVFGIPLHRFGIVTSNMSLEQSNLDYLYNTLSPYMEAVIAELNFKLIAPAYDGLKSFRFDTESFKMADSSTYINNLKTQVDTGLLSLDEARKKLGQEPIPGGFGAKHRVSLNYVAIDKVDEYQNVTSTDNRLLSEGGETNE